LCEYTKIINTKKQKNRNKKARRTAMAAYHAEERRKDPPTFRGEKATDARVLR
jgi:hypothetical protein